MAFIEPVFDGTYSGEQVFNITNYLIGDEFIKYIDTIEVAHDSVFDKQTTGFSTVKYHLNAVTSEQKPGYLQITLVSDLPKALCQQLQQLAKGCLGAGMSLFVADDNLTASAYYCKWENAGEFTENSELLCGGSLLFKFYFRGDVTYILLQATTPGTAQVGHMNISGTGTIPTVITQLIGLTPQASAPATDASRPQIYCLTANPKTLYVKWADGTTAPILEVE